jgi:hypothetical protein
VRQRHKLHFGVLAIAAMASLLFVPAASATIVGTLNTANCLNGGVTVVGNLIDFFLPVDSGTGCIQANSGLFFGPTASTPFAGDAVGVIQDLTSGGGTVLDFIVLNAGGGVTLHFDLTSIGPGVANTNCALAIPCSLVAGSPFVLSANSGGTAIALPAFGTAFDSLSPTDMNTFGGAFTTQIASLTPAEIQAAFIANPAAPITANTVSGTFVLGTVPEPVSMALIGGGLVALALLRRRARRV